MKRFFDIDAEVSEIVIATKVLFSKSRAVHKNRFSHGFAIFEDGERIFHFSDRNLFVGKNDMIFMPKHTDYHVETIVPADCYAINFDLHEDMTFEPFVFTPKNPTMFFDMFKSAEKAWKTKKDGYIYKCKSELYSVLYNMKNEINDGYLPSSKFSIIAPATTLIHEKFTSEQLSVAQLSELCGISPEYFRSLFRKKYGASPVKYINGLKISRAKELLLSGMYSVSAAAEMSGFSDMCYFSKEFKKATGVSPSKFLEE